MITGICNTPTVAPKPGVNPRAALSFPRFPTFVYLPIFVVRTIAMAMGERWALFLPNGFISPVMAAGCFVAGSTSIGGGAVPFPVITLVFDITPGMARDFSDICQ